MTQSKKIGILLGVLLALCLAAAAVRGFQQHQEAIRLPQETILQIPTESVTALAWDSKNAPQPLSYHKNQDQWIYDADESFPVNGEKLEQLLVPFQQFVAAFAIEGVEDYGQYGLDDPLATIRITAGETEYCIELGEFSAMDSQRYLSIGDGNVYLAEHDPMDEFSAVLGATMLHDEIPEFDKVSSILFEGEEPYRIEYQENSGNSLRDEDVYFRGTDPLDPDKVESYLNTLSRVILENDVNYKVTPEELAAYGLDRPELTITVDYLPEDAPESETPQRIAVSISQDPAEKARNALDAQAAEGDAEEPEETEEITAYLRVDQSPIVYQISTTEYGSLMAYHYNDLRHSQILPMDTDRIAAVEVLLEEGTHRFTSERDADDVRVWSCEGEAMEFAELESALAGLWASEFTEQGPSGPQEIAVTLTMDDERSTQSTLALYRQDGERCLVTLDAKPLAFVSRTQMVALTEAVRAIVLG